MSVCGRSCLSFRPRHISTPTTLLSLTTSSSLSSFSLISSTFVFISISTLGRQDELRKSLRLLSNRAIQQKGEIIETAILPFVECYSSAVWVICWNNICNDFRFYWKLNLFKLLMWSNPLQTLFQFSTLYTFCFWQQPLTKYRRKYQKAPKLVKNFQSY